MNISASHFHHSTAISEKMKFTSHTNFINTKHSKTNNIYFGFHSDVEKAEVIGYFYLQVRADVPSLR